VRGYTIGCERCHGPGELHVRLREGGRPVEGMDDTIVNPRDLPYALREDVCQQCHLSGSPRVPRLGLGDFDYRPGLALPDFMSLFVPPPEAADKQKAISTVELMALSRCYRATKGSGKLGCISCHDPHRMPAEEEKTAYYRNRCLTCHADQGCKLDLKVRLQKNPADSCTACHMPRMNSSNIAHVPLTDHSIPRHARANAPRLPLMPPDDIVHFHADRVDMNDPQMARDLGYALAMVAKEGKPQLTPRALSLLDAALARWPADPNAREARGLVYLLQKREPEALADLEDLLARYPQWESALPVAGWTAGRLGRPEEAEAYWRRAIAINPYYSKYHLELGKLLANRLEWSLALAEAQAALRLNPADVEVHKLLGRCYLGLGNPQQARDEVAIIQAFQTPPAKAPR
jgi:Flp pilus assembly protein TadD